MRDEMMGRLQGDAHEEEQAGAAGKCSFLFAGGVVPGLVGVVQVGSLRAEQA
jgi:hypothetical protein